MKVREIRTCRLETGLAEPFACSEAWYERRGAMPVALSCPPSGG